MQRCSRRRALALGGAVLAPAAAGCSVFGGSEESDSGVRSWLPGDQIVSSQQATVTYQNVGRLRRSLPEDHERVQQLFDRANRRGLLVNQIDGVLVVDVDDTLATVFTGSFDGTDVLDRMEADPSNIERHGDFSVVGGVQAVGPGAVVVSASPQTFVDVYRGEADRIDDLDEYWDAALDDFTDADTARIASRASEPFEVLALSVDAEEGPRFVGDAVARFASESLASDHRNVVEHAVREVVDDGVETEVQDVAVDGSTVQVDAVWDAIPF